MVATKFKSEQDKANGAKLLGAAVAIFGAGVTVATIGLALLGLEDEET